MCGLGQGAFNRPASAQPILQDSACHAEFSSPLRNVHGLIVECDITPARRILSFSKFIWASISDLFAPSCPPTIFFRVWAVIIREAINRVFRTRSWSHVAQKHIETVSPFVADVDAASSVIVEILTGRVIAAFFHPAPRFIFWRLIPSWCRTMHGATLHNRFTTRATAAFRMARREMSRCGDRDVSAIASAYPSDVLATVKTLLNYHQRVESTTSQVDHFHTAQFYAALSLAQRI